ncbi:MAG: tetratricopeptide repeat protein, partial [Planctomycetota bacterium]
MKERFTRLLTFLVFGLGSVLYGQTPSDALADFDQAEEAVFSLKGTGEYLKAQKKLTDAFVQIARTITSGPEELKPELIARGECYLELLYALADSTARYAVLDEALDPVSIPAPMLANLKRYIQMQLKLHTGKIADVRALKNELGFIDCWHLIGPFDNERGGGFNTVYDPEILTDLGGIYQGKERQVRWRMNPCETLTGYINLDALFNPHDQCLAYALLFLSSDEEKDICLRLSSDEAVKVFMNGETVYAQEARRLYHFGQDTIGLHLQKGMNALMLKVCDQTGPWGFSSRLTALSGAPLKDVKIVDDPGSFTLPKSSEPHPEIKPDAGAIQYFITRAAEGDVRAHLYLGMLHQFREFRGEDEGLATLHLDEFLEENPEHIYAHDLYAQSVQKRYDMATEKDENAWRSRLERIVQLNSDHVESLIRLGQYYITSITIPDKALEYAKAAFKANPNFLPASYLFSDVYRIKNMNARSKKAIIDLSHKKENLSYPGLLIRLGDIAKSERRMEEACEFWQSVLKINFSSPEARYRLLNYALESGNVEEARRLLHEGLDLDPYDSRILKTLADLSQEEAGKESALALLEHALRINPEDDDAMKRFGDVHYALGQMEQALRSYRQALEINPKAKDLRRHVEFLFEGERPFEEGFKVDVLALAAS